MRLVAGVELAVDGDVGLRIAAVVIGAVALQGT